MVAGTARRSAWMWMGALALGVSGCGSAPAPPPTPTTVSGSIEASARLNPTTGQRPSPLQMRIYELKSAAAFGSADFMALFQGDQAALGAEMLAKEEMTLRPGETRPYMKTLAGETRFIGIVAIYRDLERATWRTVVPVQPGRAQKLTVRVGELAVSATIGP